MRRAYLTSMRHQQKDRMAAGGKEAEDRDSTPCAMRQVQSHVPPIKHQRPPRRDCFLATVFLSRFAIQWLRYQVYTLFDHELTSFVATRTPRTPTTHPRPELTSAANSVGITRSRSSTQSPFTGSPCRINSCLKHVHCSGMAVNSVPSESRAQVTASAVEIAYKE